MILVKCTPKGSSAYARCIPLIAINTVTHDVDTGCTWVKFWDGDKHVSVVTEETPEQIARLVYIAKHGKAPAKSHA